jgi:hypothetical protein
MNSYVAANVYSAKSVAQFTTAIVWCLSPADGTANPTLGGTGRDTTARGTVPDS